MDKKKHTIEELNRYYFDAEGVDQEVFAEQRSNILLYSGEHYNKRTSYFYKRVRDSKDLSNEQKIRLTKNHTQFICDSYVNNIVAPNPGVGFSAKNEKEAHDQKVAQMHHAVWRDAHERYNIDDKIDDWADNLVQIGECITKVYFDPMKGKLKAYEQKATEEGEPLFLDPSGAETKDDGSLMGTQFGPAPNKEKPIFEGEFEFEDIYGFNLLRPPECKDIRTAAWLGIRKMAYTKDLVARWPDKEKLFKGSGGNDETYRVFDNTAGGYTKSKDQTLITEWFFRPCVEYPNGYFYFSTREGIFEEGELPGGIFPIVFQPFRKFATTPRGRSPIKTMRPYQAEINRSASKMAEHQITLGDDKILLHNGSKVSYGASLPGIRTVNITGQDPTLMAGRDGSQYLNYMTSQIAELYQVMGVAEDMQDMPAQLDPYQMLFRSARQKKRFQRYIKRFEKFLIEVVKTYLRLAKIHLPDDALIYAVGATERVNIPEFRSQPDICYEINIEAQSDDIETKLGKQISISQTLQYVGGKLDKEDIGKLMRAMPYANYDQSFDDLTINYDNSVNDILALDRGEKPPVNQYDDHVYSIKRLVSRMRQADFKYLNPQIQNSYAQKVHVHEQFEAQRQIAIQQAEQGYIPTGGYLSKCDLYTADPSDPNKTNRVTLPSEALQWLVKQLQAQQSGMAPLANLNGGAQAQIAQQVSGGMSPQENMNQGMAPGNGMPPMLS